MAALSFASDFRAHDVVPACAMMQVSDHDCWGNTSLVEMGVNAVATIRARIEVFAVVQVDAIENSRKVVKVSINGCN